MQRAAGTAIAIFDRRLLVVFACRALHRTMMTMVGRGRSGGAINVVITRLEAAVSTAVHTSSRARNNKEYSDDDL